RCELLLALGSAQMKAGDVPQARSSFLQAARVAQNAEVPALLTRAALGFEKIGVEVGKVDQPLVTLLEDTLHVLGEADSGERARYMRGRVERLADLLELGEMRVVDLELETYLSLAQTLRQPRYLWYGQLMRATRALMEGQFTEGERLIQQAFHLGQRVQPET